MPSIFGICGFIAYCWVAFIAKRQNKNGKLETLFQRMYREDGTAKDLFTVVASPFVFVIIPAFIVYMLIYPILLFPTKYFAQEAFSEKVICVDKKFRKFTGRIDVFKNIDSDQKFEFAGFNWICDTHHHKECNIIGRSSILGVYIDNVHCKKN